MYTNLVIEGGGAKAYASIGCVKVFEEEKIIGDFKNLIGTSAGSIIATLIAIGCSSGEMKKYFSRVDLSRFKVKYKSIFTYFNIIIRNGVHNPSKFEKIMYDILKEKTGDGDITFRQIYERYGKFLVITGTCLNKRITHYYHHESNPHMKVKNAIKISCCIPLLFYPVKWKGDTLCDGGLLDNYPLYFFNNVKIPDSRVITVKDEGADICDETIGIKYIDDTTTTEKLYTGNDEIRGIGSFLKSVVNTFITGVERKGIKENYWEKTIAINTGDLDIIDMSISDTQKENLLRAGYESSIKFFEIKKIKYFTNVNK